MYTKDILKAMDIAFKAHNGQVDKGGSPYIFHPMHLAEQCVEEETKIVALLHDVVEDTPVTIEDLRKEGFKEECLIALSLLTHEKGVPYMDYIEKIGCNPIATKVKILDLKHNMDQSRLVNIELSEKTKEKIAKKLPVYQKALEYLEKPFI